MTIDALELIALFAVLGLAAGVGESIGSGLWRLWRSRRVVPGSINFKGRVPPEMRELAKLHGHTVTFEMFLACIEYVARHDYAQRIFIEGVKAYSADPEDPEQWADPE